MEGVVYDITQTHQLLEALKRENARMRYLKLHDPLTGLGNREALEHALRQLTTRHLPFGLIILDIDGFGKINTTCGHECGDAVLKAVARRLADAYPDQLYRISVDEFALITPQLPNDHLCQQLHERFSTPISTHGQSFHLSIALGCSRYPADARTAEALIQTAQAALRFAKQSEQRHKTRFYRPEMRDSLSKERFLIDALKQDLSQDRDRFIVYYQPQIDCRDDTLSGVEALVRWMGPDDALLPPGDFLPIALRAGLMPELDIVVAEQALKQLRLWQEAGHDQIRLSLNCSPASLNEDRLHALLMKQHADLLDRVTLELTEEALMRCSPAELSAIARLRDSGARLAIDDFGTGYASLRYLHQLPVDELKIDRSFVRNLPENTQDGKLIAIIRHIIETFGFEAVVEGVETPAQRDYFCAQGLHTIQGYLYSPPIPAEDLASRFMKG